MYKLLSIVLVRSLANLLEELKKLNKVLVKADSDLRAAVTRNPKVRIIHLLEFTSVT